MNNISRQFIGIFLFVLLSFNIQGQSQDPATPKDSKKPDKADSPSVKTGQPDSATQEETQKLLKEILAKIEKGDGQSITVGSVHLINDSKANLYMENDSLVDSTIIDSVTIFLNNGFIIEIQVFANDDVFINGYPIEMSHAGIRRKPYVLNQDDLHINLSEILQYRSVRPFSPNNDHFTLKKDSTKHTFSKGVGLNDVFDLRFYSDALGFLGGKANGLVQTEASLKQNLKGWRSYRFGFASHVKFNFNVSKFDSKLGFTDSTNFTRASLLRKSWLNTDLSINIFNSWMGSRTLNTYFMDFGAGLSLSDLAKSTDTTTILSPYFFLTGGIDLVPADNVGVSLTSKLMWTFIPETDFPNENGGHWFVKSTLGIFWNPLDDETGRIFGRFSYILDLHGLKGSFLQVQLGYTLKLKGI